MGIASVIFSPYVAVLAAFWNATRFANVISGESAAAAYALYIIYIYLMASVCVLCVPYIIPNLLMCVCVSRVNATAISTFCATLTHVYRESEIVVCGYIQI